MTKGVLSSGNSQEVKLLASSRRLASGHSLRRNIQDFESLSETLRFTRVCEDATFVHRAASGMSHKTRPDEDDGFGHTKPPIQSFCSNSWKNIYWTSHWSSDRENSWPIWTTQRSLATVAVIRDQKDGRLLPHPIRRQSRLTRRKILTREVRMCVDKKLY